MALTNLVLGAAVLAAAALLFATDIRKSGAMFRRNARKIWAWLDEEMKSASAVSRKFIMGLQNPRVGQHHQLAGRRSRSCHLHQLLS
ncbi:hypothetical protein DAI22_01g265400 [Oryza sativa Japonica Group]|nr:hypothetical protein DAI22_01g265400 [Oryza sativa Japonica Group]